MAELEELLLKVDSELGDLGGIDTAIQALANLKDFSEKATRGADSLVALSDAFKTLNAEGRNLGGINNIKQQIGTLTGILDTLAEHTRSADKTIKQLGDLGDALTKFAGLGESLKGLDGITKGVNDMVGVLGSLGGLQTASKKASDNIKKTGENIKKETDKTVKDINASAKKMTDANKHGFDSDIERDNRVLERKIAERRKLILKLVETEEANYSARRNGDSGRAEELRVEAMRYSKALKDSNKLIAQIDKYAQGNINSANFNGAFEKSDAELKSLIEERESILNDYKNFTENFFSGTEKGSTIGQDLLDPNVKKAYQETLDDYQNELARLTTKISTTILKMKSNVSSGLSQSFEDNTVVDNFAKSTDALANSFDKVSLSADKAYKNIAMTIHAMAKFGYGIDRNEQGAVFNFPTDYASKVQTSGNRNSIDVEPLYREVVDRLKQTIDTDIHSHPEFNVASFSPADISVSLNDFFEKNIKQSLVTARKEISSFDMTKLKFADSYRDIIGDLFDNKIAELGRTTFTPNLFEIDAIMGKNGNVSEYFSQRLLQPLEDWFGENNVDSNIDRIRKLFNDYFAEYKGLESIPLDSSVIADALSERLSSAFNTGDVEGLSDILSERINNIFYHVSEGINGKAKALDDWQNLVKNALRETLSYLGEDIDNVYNSFSVNDYTKLLSVGIRPEELLQNNKELQSLIEQRRDIMTKLTDINSDISIDDILKDGQINYSNLEIKEDTLKSELQKVDEEISALKKKIIADATEKIDFEIPEVQFIEESNKELENLVKNRENIVVKLHELKERIATEDDTPTEAVNDKSKKEVFSEVAKRYEERIALINEKINELKEKTIKSPQVDESSFEQVESRLEEFYVRQKYLKEHLTEMNKSGEKDSTAIVDIKTTEEQLSLVTGAIQRLEEAKNHLKPVNVDDAIKVDDSSEKAGTFADAISNMKDALTGLDSISAGIELLSKLGEALHSFNGLDDNVKALYDVAQGLGALISVADVGDQLDEHSFDFIVHVKKALDTLNANSSGYENIGRATQGLADLIGWLDSSNTMDLSKLDLLKEKMLTLNDADFKGTTFELGKAVQSLNDAFNSLHTSAGSIIETMGVIDYGFDEAYHGLQNTREQIEIISQDFDSVLSPVVDSNLIDILEKFRSLNDSYKNVGGIAQGLGVLLDALFRINGKEIDTHPIENLLYYMKQLADTNLPEEVAKKFEKFEGVSDSMARLFNAIKYFQTPLDPNRKTVFGYLKGEIENFNKDIDGRFDQTRNLLYGFKSAFEALQKDSSVIKEDNLFEWLKEEIKEFDKLGGQGGNLKVIGNLLRGIADITKMMNEGVTISKKADVFDNLKSKLQDLYNFTIQQGGMTGEFAKISNLLKSITDMAYMLHQGVTFKKDDNLIVDLAEALKKFDPSVLTNLDQMTNVFKSVKDLIGGFNKITYKNDESVKAWLKALAEGLMEINVASSDMSGVEKALNSVTRLVTTIDSADKGMSADDNPLKSIGLGLEKVTDELKKLDGADKAVNSVSKLIDTVDKSTVGDNNALTKITDSVKEFNNVKDIKDVGTLANNLNKLVDIVGNTKLGGKNGRTKNAIDHIVDSIKKFDSVQTDKGQLSSIAKEFTKLINVVAENDEKIGQDNVITRLVTSLNGFKNIAENTKGLKGTLNAIVSLINVAGQKVDFGKDNPLSQLKRILGGFADIAKGTAGLDKVMKTLLQAIDVMKQVNGQDFKVDPDNNPFAVLKTQLEGFKQITSDLEGFPKIIKALKDFIKEFDSTKGFQVDAQPIANIIGAVWYANGADGAVENFKNIIKSIKDVSSKANGSNLHDIAVGMSDIARVIVPFSKAGKLQSLIDVANAMVKMKDVDLDKFKQMAEAIRDIMQALGSFNGNNNTIKITLDERGIINAEHDIKEAHKAWLDYKLDVMRDIQTIDLSNMFDISGSTKHLKEELKKAQQALNNALKERQRWQDSMKQTERVRGEKGAQEDDRYRRAYANYWKAKKEADEYRQAVDNLSNAIRIRNGYELEGDAEGYRLRKSLTEEKKRIEETLRSMRDRKNAPQLEIFGDATKQSEVIDMFERRLRDINVTIQQINNELRDGVSSTVEGLQEQVSQLNQEWDEQLDKIEKANKEMTGKIGDGISQLGNTFKNIPVFNKSEGLGAISDLISKLGQDVSSGKLNLGLSTEQLAKFSAMATKATTVLGILGTSWTILAKLYKDCEKLRDMLIDFTKKAISFARTMLSKVVGAFNAVAGAVSKVASAVKSGAEIIVSAVRKIGEVGSNIISIFGKVGSAFAPAMKGIKAVLSMATPKIVKTLANADFSLGNIIKKSRVLSKSLKTFTRWFTTMSRMLMRRTITKFFNEVKQAFEDLVVFEKESGDAMLNLNTNVSKIFSGLRISANQWIGAFEPLINALTPTILTFLNQIQVIGENVAKFMAILTGQPYYIKAKQFYEDYGQSVEDTNKKVKDLTNGLDELNILNDSKDKDGIKPEDMFEKVPVDGEILGFPELKDILDAIKEWLINIDWAKIKQKVKDFIHKLMQIINEILADVDLWSALGTTLGEIFNTLMEAWNQFIKDFDPVLLANAISAFIVNALKTIDWDLIHENIKLTAEKFAKFWNEIFADDELWNQIANAIVNLLNGIVEYFATFAWNFDFAQMATQLTNTIINILTNFDYTLLQSAVDGWVSGLVTFFNTTIANKEFWKTLGESFAKMINATLIQALKDLTLFDFVGLSDSIKLAITSAIDGITWEDLKTSIATLTDNIIAGINDFFTDAEFLTKCTTAFAGLVNILITSLKQALTGIKAEDIANAISSAIINGLALINWDDVFTLPADAINFLVNALNGLLDAIPDEILDENGNPVKFNLGEWLTDKLILTMDSIDWEKLTTTLEKFGKEVADFITGVLQNKEFWQKAGATTGKVIKIGLDLVFDIFNVNGEDLGTAVSEFINNLVNEVDLGEYIEKAVNLAVNLVIALDVILKETDWNKIGQQIGDGLVDAINTLYTNSDKIKQTIEDAFGSFGTLMEEVFQKMIADNSFYKLGQALGKIGLGIIDGLAEFFNVTLDEILSGMAQFAEGLADYLKSHKQEIVDGLNKIIDGITDILIQFFDEKGELYNAVNDIVDELHLGELLGTILHIIIVEFTERLKNTNAVMEAISGDMPALIEALKSAIWELIKTAFEGAIKNFFSFDFLDLLIPSNWSIFAWADLIKKLLGIKDDGSLEIKIGEIVDKVVFWAGDFWEKLKTAWNNFLAWIKTKAGELKEWWDNIEFPWNKKSKIPIHFEGFDWSKLWSDIKTKWNNFTSNLAKKAKELKNWWDNIDFPWRKNKTISLGDLFGGFINEDSFIGKIVGAWNTFIDKIKSKFSALKNWWEVEAPWNKNKKVNVEGEVDFDDNSNEKKIIIENTEWGTITATTINCEYIYAQALYVGEIFANKLSVGEIDGEYTGKINIPTIPSSVSGKDKTGNKSVTGDRWSDLVGLDNAEEIIKKKNITNFTDFSRNYRELLATGQISGLSNTSNIDSINKLGDTTVVQKAKNYSEGGVNATGGTLTNPSMTSTSILGDLVDTTNSQMAEVYDVIDSWLLDIYNLLSSFKVEGFLSGLTDSIQTELGKALDYIKDWHDKAKNYISDAFSDLSQLKDLGDINVNVTGNTGTSSLTGVTGLTGNYSLTTDSLKAVTFEKGNRWSDLSGAVPSAEEYLDYDLKNLFNSFGTSFGTYTKTVTEQTKEIEKNNKDALTNISNFSNDIMELASTGQVAGVTKNTVPKVNAKATAKVRTTTTGQDIANFFGNLGDTISQGAEKVKDLITGNNKNNTGTSSTSKDNSGKLGAKDIYDYLLETTGNKNGAEALFNSLYHDVRTSYVMETGDNNFDHDKAFVDAVLERMSMSESELQKFVDKQKSDSNYWKKLTTSKDNFNSQEFEKLLKDAFYENGQIGKHSFDYTAHTSNWKEWHDIVDGLPSTSKETKKTEPKVVEEDKKVEIPEKEVPKEDTPKEDKKADVIVEDKKQDIYFLQDLPLQTEYTMAVVYNIIDTWLGRIWKLLKSFKAPNIIANVLDDFGTFTKKFNEYAKSLEKFSKSLSEFSTNLEKYVKNLNTLVDELDSLIDKLANFFDYGADSWSKGASSFLGLVDKFLKDLRDKLTNTKIQWTWSFDYDKEKLASEFAKLHDYISNYAKDYFAENPITIGTSLGLDTTTMDKNTNAIEENTKAIMKLVQNGLGNVTCNCNCGGNCGNCAMGGNGGNGGKGEVVNIEDEPTPTSPTTNTTTNTTDTTPYNPTQTSTSTTQNNPTGTTTTPTGTTTTPTGTTTTPTGTTTTPTGTGTNTTNHPTGTVSTGTNGGNNQIVLWQNGKSVPMFATIGGKPIRLTDNLSDDIKKQILSGAFPFTDAKGNPLSAKDKNNMLKYLRNRWKNLDDKKNSAYYLRENGEEENDNNQLYAIVDGKKVALSDYLDNKTKNRIANGIFHDVDFVKGDGTKVTDDKDLTKIRNQLIASGWRDTDKDIPDENVPTNDSPTSTPSSGTGKGKCKNCELKDKARRYGIDMFDKNGNFIGYDNLEKLVNDYENGKKSSGSNVPTSGTNTTTPTGTVKGTSTTPVGGIKGTSTTPVSGVKNTASTGDVKGTEPASNGNIEPTTNTTEVKDEPAYAEGGSTPTGGEVKQDTSNQQEETKKELPAINKSYYTGNQLGMTDKEAEDLYNQRVSNVNDYRSQGQDYYNRIMSSGTDAQKQDAQNKLNTLNTNGNYLNDDVYKSAMEQLKDTAYQAEAKSNPDSIKAKAKEILDNIKNSGTSDSNKKQAEMLYNNVLIALNKKNYKGVSQHMAGLEEYLEKSKEKVDMSDQTIRIGMNGKHSTWYTPDDKGKTLTLSESTKKSLARAIYTDKDDKGNKVYWYNADDSNAIKDQNKINEMKEVLKKAYNITENDLPAGVKATATVTSSTSGGKDYNAPTSEGKDYSSKTTESKESAKKEETASAKPSNITLSSSGYEGFLEALNKDADVITKAYTPYDAKGKHSSLGFVSGIGNVSNDIAKKIYNIQKGYVGELPSPQITTMNTTPKITLSGANFKQGFDAWYNRFLAKGYQMGGMPNSGEIFVARENGSPEFVGKFGSNTAVANNDQIVTAVANGVSMAHDRLVNAIENQTNTIEQAIDRKDLDVTIGDRQIAEANKRGQEGMGTAFVN